MLSGYKYCDRELRVDSNDGSVSDCKWGWREWTRSSSVKTTWGMSLSVLLPNASVRAVKFVQNRTHLLLWRIKGGSILMWRWVPLDSVEATLIFFSGYISAADWDFRASSSSQKSETWSLWAIHRPLWFQHFHTVMLSSYHYHHPAWWRDSPHSPPGEHLRPSTQTSTRGSDLQIR